MQIELSDPNIIMKLSRLGSFHQSKISFLRSFLEEFKNFAEDLGYGRDFKISSIIGTEILIASGVSSRLALY